MVGEAQSGWRFCLPCFAVRWTYSLDTVMFVGKQLYVYNIIYIYICIHVDLFIGKIVLVISTS